MINEPENPAKAGRWVKSEREARGWSANDLANRINGLAQDAGDPTRVSQQVVSKFEQGLNKRKPAWVRYCSTAFSDTGFEPDMLPTVSAYRDDEVAVIKSLDLSISMGPGTLIEEFVEEQPVKFDLAVLRAITRRPFYALRLVRGIGESMEPTLKTSDGLLIDTSEKTLARNHGIYWIDHEGAHGVKRLRPLGKGRVLIMSDNPNVPDYEVDAEDMRIHGRAIWLMRDL